MGDEQTVSALIEGYETMCLWSRNIAMLPLEDWRQALDRAETLGPIMDPTLYREYLYSDKAKALREILDACIKLKAVVMKYQPLDGKDNPHE